MKNKETIFDYIGQIFLIFGFTIVCLNIFCVLFGEDAREYSTIFSLGKEGLGVSTMLQFLLASTAIVTLRFLFFTDRIIKNVSVAIRTAGMFISIILIMMMFIAGFRWFPVDMWRSWTMFFICFGISAGVSTAVSVLKEKMENKKMEDALQRLKKEEERE